MRGAIVSLPTRCLIGVLLVLPGCRTSTDEPRDFARWEKEIAAFEKQDGEKAPPRNAVLFVGSSSIRLWDVARSFQGMDVINRGFGGSQVADAAHFAPRLVSKHQPRVVVFYAGDNDIAAGRKPQQVLEDFQSFVRAVRKDLPQTRILFVSIKPSPRRWSLQDEMTRANALVEAFCKREHNLAYVDVVKPMLGADGKPRPELFVKDGLHLNADGYSLWTKLVQPHLKG